MNIEYKKESILQLIFQLIENDYRKIHRTSFELIVTDYTFKVGGNLFLDDDDAVYNIKYKPSTNSMFFNKNDIQNVKQLNVQIQKFDVLNIEFNDLKIIITPATDTKYSLTSQQYTFKPHFFLKSISYDVITHTIVDRFEINFQKKLGNSSGYSKNYSISKLEYLTIFETYKRSLQEQLYKKEQAEIKLAQDEITQDIGKLMDTYKIPKFID